LVIWPLARIYFSPWEMRTECGQRLADRGQPRRLAMCNGWPSHPPRRMRRCT